MAKILVVDDSPTQLQWMRLVLISAGHQVVTHDAGFGTGAAIVRAQPDLVILDVLLPGVSGDEVLSLFDQGSSGARSFKVVLHSSLEAPELAQRVKTCGADGYIVKTNDPAAFLRQVATCLSKGGASGAA